MHVHTHTHTHTHAATNKVGCIPEHVTLKTNWKPMNSWSDQSMRWEKDKVPVQCVGHIEFDITSVFTRIVTNNAEDLKQIALELIQRQADAALVMNRGHLKICDVAADAAVARRKKRPRGSPGPMSAESPP